jgi:hypothetical protein
VNARFRKPADGVEKIALPFHPENVILVWTDLSAGVCGCVRIIFDKENLNRHSQSGTGSVNGGFRAS